MSKLRSLIAAAMLFPLLAFGGYLDAGELDTAAATEVASAATGEAAANGCCWLFYMGRWYCVPC